MFVFGINSKKQLANAHEDLQILLNETIKCSPIDFGIRESYRPISVQQKYYAQGRTTPGRIITKIDGVTKKSKHNYFPARAVDLYIYVKSNPSKYFYNEKYLLYLMGFIAAKADELYKKGLMKNKIRWGGNWDMDDMILTDQDFDDIVHIELI